MVMSNVVSSEHGVLTTTGFEGLVVKFWNNMADALC